MLTRKPNMAVILQIIMRNKLLTDKVRDVYYYSDFFPHTWKIFFFLKLSAVCISFPALNSMF